jgi:hypothetical protein
VLFAARASGEGHDAHYLPRTVGLELLGGHAVAREPALELAVDLLVDTAPTRRDNVRPVSVLLVTTAEYS